jgi:hypothetical protein
MLDIYHYYRLSKAVFPIVKINSSWLKFEVSLAMENTLRWSLISGELS